MNTYWPRIAGPLAMVLAIGTIAFLSILHIGTEPLRRSVYELAMSDNVGLPAATVMRFIGYIVPGLLIVPVGVRLFVNGRSNWFGRIGAILLVLSGISWTMLGVFPPQFGDEQTMVLNGMLTLLFAISGGFAFLLLAFGLPWRFSSVVLLTLSCLPVFATILAASPSLPMPGLLERLCIAVYFIWIGILGTAGSNTNNFHEPWSDSAKLLG